jgi:L-alanine-DL-glutamate epimerase-like enolase superfamily enzyme
VPLRFAYAPHRLLFRQPFGTSHGMRDGTDALFIRLEEKGCQGFGEVTLPPYVQENVVGALAHFTALAESGPWEAQQLLDALAAQGLLTETPALRAAVHTALLDLLGRMSGRTVRDLLGVPASGDAIALMTIGICRPEEVAERLAALPASGGLKLKVGDELQLSRLQTIVDSNLRLILLDGNQGLQDVRTAAALARLAGDRLLGFEQPFPVGREAWCLDLAALSGALVIGDESLQDRQDLERLGRYFGGVNLKLMKCGGLDRALDMIELARRSGLRVMLGSMSESALGCTAMAQLAGRAQLLDLDGPWLLRNDPCKGIRMVDGRLQLPDGPGLGVEVDRSLALTHIGA